MSDFGVVIIIKKNSGHFNAGDKANIGHLLAEIIQSGDYADTVTNDNFQTLDEWGENTLCSKLTEYYNGDDADEVREFAEEDELPDAEEIAEALQENLGPDFSVSASLEDW